MDAFFPVAYRFGDSPTDGIGGTSVDDAGAIYICRNVMLEEDWPNGDYNLPTLVKKTSITELVNEILDGCRGFDGFTADLHVPASDSLAEAFRKAADMLDSAKRPKSNEE